MLHRQVWDQWETQGACCTPQLPAGLVISEGPGMHCMSYSNQPVMFCGTSQGGQASAGC